MRPVITIIANHRWINLFIGLIVLVAGGAELSDNLIHDWQQKELNLRAAHGVALLGFWHVLKAFADIFESFEYLAVSSAATSEIEAQSDGSDDEIKS